jgi:hypothetical protein
VGGKKFTYIVLASNSQKHRYTPAVSESDDIAIDGLERSIRLCCGAEKRKVRRWHVPALPDADRLRDIPVESWQAHVQSGPQEVAFAAMVGIHLGVD